MPRGGAKPGERRGGRAKGTPNKITQTIKEALEASFNQVGGAAYLAEMARKEPKAYMAMLGKAMPQQINANVQAALLPGSIDDFLAPPPPES